MVSPDAYEHLKNFASPGDIPISMSGSGNSKNVLQAVEWANGRGLITWGLTGYDGGELRSLAQRNLHIPVDDMGMAQSMHLLVFHWILDYLHARINGKGRYFKDQSAIIDHARSADVHAE